ncbi:MAG: SNF2-related protein [Xanthomonadales bacterium]|nr:SNF2-related protein [Xanthomonadales bacterium]
MSFLKRFRRDSAAPHAGWYAREDAEGVQLSRSPSAGARALPDPLLDGWLCQLQDEGFIAAEADGHWIPWDTIYALRDHPEHAQALELLGLPPEAPVVPALQSWGSLEDRDFAVFVVDWWLGSQRLADEQWQGAVHVAADRRLRMPAACWALLQEVRRFARRPAEERNGQHHRLAWGRIRRMALQAGARLDSFLHRCVVLTPEKLEIGIRKAQVGDDRVIEVQPTFDGAPPDWLERFDRAGSVPARYDIPTADGIVQVIVSDEVRAVLSEIKGFTHRRVAGARAQAFMLNPYATLGGAAHEVIDETQFEAARAAAGLGYERFLPQFERDAQGYPLKVGLLVESASEAGPLRSETVWLDDPTLAKFVAKFKAALARGFPLLGWEGYDFELQGDAAEHLAALQEALAERQRPPVLIRYADVHDLSHYAARVLEIGIEQPYYSPYIAKKEAGDGWFPENLVPVIAWTPEGETETRAIPATPALLAQIQQSAEAARAAGLGEISCPGLPTPMSVAEAERISGTFAEAFEDAARGEFDPDRPQQIAPGAGGRRKTPVLLPNIAQVDYSESGQRAAALSAVGREPELPGSLRPDCRLLPHQRAGVAWLQTLFQAPEKVSCRGALLADDMGLGKTLQLLTLMAWAIEKHPELEPMLVVAPVSLLENWKAEVGKFFREGALPVLTAYGDALAALRVPPEAIDARLRDEDGLTRFLRPGWLGHARIVLTTYETLRDLEFSFAMQAWSIMVCDEAQKIKNPAAMVTRAAKKQKVRFKIACTGTPVENTLADLWCLFDFIQPGLLGALNDFGHRYRKPIEAVDEEKMARVRELRQLVEPQILRRTKAEVAKDLPRKIEVQSCRSLPLSVRQRELYARAIEQFKRRNQPGAAVPFKNHLGLLHYLRLICTDPRRHGLEVFRPDPLAEYRGHAPKLDWLLRELESIRQRAEKVIVFCEFRGIQRLLQHYINEVFGLRPDIINGDTSAAPGNAQSRQRRLDTFQQRPGFGVIILSPVAVGFGVNIQAANHVIHYTRTWNPAKEDQATDRAYRIGQQRDVHVYCPVVRAEDFATFDVKLDQLLAIKRELAQDMLNGAGDVRPGDFTVEDVAPPEAGYVAETVRLATAQALDGHAFEALVAVLYGKRGYQVIRTPASGDHGVDVVALQPGTGCGKLIQAKASANEGARLGWEGVKDVVAGRAHYASRYRDVAFELVCITNQCFNPNAHAQAVTNGVELIEQTTLAAMLAETPVTMAEVEGVHYADWDG